MVLFMPRFYFHVHDDDIELDTIGLEFPNAEAAKGDALRGARDLACDEVSRGFLKLDHRVEVQDSAGAVVASISFRDAVAIIGEAAGTQHRLGPFKRDGCRCVLSCPGKGLLGSYRGLRDRARTHRPPEPREALRAPSRPRRAAPA